MVVVPDNLSGPEKKAVEMFVDEVHKRTQIRWPVSHAWPTGNQPCRRWPGLVPAEFGGKFSDAMSKEADQYGKQPKAFAFAAWNPTWPSWATTRGACCSASAIFAPSAHEGRSDHCSTTK